jgi:hypothetical protein
MRPSDDAGIHLSRASRRARSGRLTVRAQPVAVANNQHSDHQFGINRWPTDVTIVRLKAFP